ncbi:hypothetical protein [Streptomyces sp. NPDC058297]|uniref:hypothetical protein n=1 Tax=unclassified Streptomyces TaxID=2593676 RepID=UPI0036E8BF7F
MAAFTDLADTALRIGDSHAGPRWGRLLEESELAGLEPVRNYASLRMAAAGVLTPGVTYLAAFIGVPGIVLPLAIGFFGVLSFNLIVGRPSRSLELLDSMRGIQRP